MSKRKAGVIALALIASAVLTESWSTSSIHASPASHGGAQQPKHFEKVKVTLTCDRTRVSLKDDHYMDVAIRNDGSEDVYLFQSLHRAQRGGQGPYIKDERGKVIYFEFDPLWPPPRPNDPTLLLRLEEGHFYGVREVRRVKDLVPTPGKYTLFVVFHPIQ